MTTTNEVANEAPEQTGVGSCLLWFVWGISISFMAILSLSLILLLVASVGLNVYLGWELSGLEMSISRPADGQSAPPVILPTQVLAIIPTNTSEAPPPPPPPVATTNSAPVDSGVSALEIQLATLSAIATQAAVQSQNTIVQGPTTTPVAIAVQLTVTPPVPASNAPAAVAINPAGAGDTNGSSAGDFAPSPDVSTEQASSQQQPPSPNIQPEAVVVAFVPPTTSNNKYTLIPIEGSREQKPAAEHGDLNLNLREPQPIQTDLKLVEIANAGSDSNAPNLGDVFPNPEIINTYTIHDWDWNNSAKGVLLKEDGLVLAGIKTNPGDPVFIPTKGQDIYQGKYFATVLYASEDSLTFVYGRVGNVSKGYTVHYKGLHVDPNLVQAFEESKGNELPGLTLNTPVGWASNELIVAIRDNGKFLDARSLKDWWD